MTTSSSTPPTGGGRGGGCGCRPCRLAATCCRETERSTRAGTSGPCGSTTRSSTPLPSIRRIARLEDARLRASVRCTPPTAWTAPRCHRRAYRTTSTRLVGLWQPPCVRLAEEPSDCLLDSLVPLLAHQGYRRIRPVPNPPPLDS